MPKARLEAEEQARVPKIELPPVGIITTRGRTRPPATAQLLACLRTAAKAAP